MDPTVLLKNGIRPLNPRKGYLIDYTLKIGERASLIPCESERSYGVVMTVDKASLTELYNQPSVSDYIPEEVTIVLDTNNTISATCYNLPSELLRGTNESYARSLYDLAKKERFPDEYLEKIKKVSIPSTKNNF